MNTEALTFPSVNRSRIVGTHFWNPPHLIPLVEVVPGDDTDPETVERAFMLLADVGKHPVRVKRDVPGFVGNRLPVLGPLENADLVGLELTHAVHDYILKHLNASPEPAPILKQKIDQGHLGFKSKSGLQTWTEQEIADTRSRLANHLITWNKAQKGR